jgi:hypothetical protein
MQAFNPASFNPFDQSHLSDAAAKRLDQRDDIDHQPRVAAVLRAPAVSPDNARFIAELLAAASRFAQRTDEFSFGKPATCRDLADKLQHFGCWASDRQADFAYKLIGWSLPRGAVHPLAVPQQAAQAPASAPIARPVAPTPAPAPETRLPRLFDLMQRLSKLTIGALTIARKNQDSLCWVKLEGVQQVVGKIEGGKLTIFAARLANTLAVDVLLRLLLVIEHDPEAAAVQHGKLSGRCSVCSRDLTDPESIARGIGPVCAEKF